MSDLPATHAIYKTTPSAASDLALLAAWNASHADGLATGALGGKDNAANLLQCYSATWLSLPTT